MGEVAGRLWFRGSALRGGEGAWDCVARGSRSLSHLPQGSFVFFMSGTFNLSCNDDRHARRAPSASSWGDIIKCSNDGPRYSAVAAKSLRKSLQSPTPPPKAPTSHSRGGLRILEWGIRPVVCLAVWVRWSFWIHIFKNIVNKV